MKKILLLLLIIPLTLTAKETDFNCSYELEKQVGFDNDIKKKFEESYRYSDEPDDRGKTVLTRNGDDHSCKVEPDLIDCFYSTRGSRDGPFYGMMPNEDGSRIHYYIGGIKINRLNLSSIFFAMKSSFNTEVFGRMDDYADYEAYGKALNKIEETLTYKGSCKVIKQEDLKF